MVKKTREEILESIRQASKSIDNKPLSQSQFVKQVDFSINNVWKHFPKWSDACIAAGIEYDKSREMIDDEELLIDWGTVARNLGHLPSLNTYKLEGKYSRQAFNRFGKWIDIPDVFTKKFGNTKEWGDVLQVIEKMPKKPKTIRIPNEPLLTTRSDSHYHPRLDNRPTYGERIDFRGLRHAPVNEQGVVFLFGMVADDLHYMVESIQLGYPDCDAKREISKGLWQNVRIEFEFESRNFIDHIKYAKECDVIVCWKHNWPECPEHLEVLELSKEIRRLKSEI